MIETFGIVDLPRQHPSGLVIVAEPSARSAIPEPAATVLDRAYRLAEQHPTDLAYPWWDEARAEVVRTFVTTQGESLARGQAARTDVPGRVVAARHSFAELERVKDDAIGSAIADLPDSDAVFQTVPVPAHNRIVVGVNSLSDALLAALAGRFGTEMIAVSYAPGESGGAAQ